VFFKLKIKLNERVPLIDDDLDDQEIFKLCVEKVHQNVNFMGLTESVEAIAMLTANSGYTPDYIFLDVNMPKMNGIQCLSALKQVERLNQCKIFMYSTTSEGELLARSKELGANDFIVKPARTAELKEKLMKIFEISDTNNN
jgi:PleD family two-component response regulator